MVLAMEPAFRSAEGWARLYVDLPGTGSSPPGEPCSDAVLGCSTPPPSPAGSPTSRPKWHDYLSQAVGHQSAEVARRSSPCWQPTGPPMIPIWAPCVPRASPSPTRTPPYAVTPRPLWSPDGAYRRYQPPVDVAARHAGLQRLDVVPAVVRRSAAGRAAEGDRRDGHRGNARADADQLLPTAPTRTDDTEVGSGSVETKVQGLANKVLPQVALWP